jgi:hypothetical protein
MWRMPWLPPEEEAAVLVFWGSFFLGILLGHLFKDARLMIAVWGCGIWFSRKIEKRQPNTLPPWLSPDRLAGPLWLLMLVTMPLVTFTHGRL